MQNKMDNLDSIFYFQKQFMHQLKLQYPVNLNTLEGQQVVREVMFFMTQEIYEGAEWMKNKPWRQTTTPLEIEKFKEEIADIFHFFIELCIVCGIEANELKELYHKKLRENYDRQKRGY